MDFGKPELRQQCAEKMLGWEFDEGWRQRYLDGFLNQDEGSTSVPKNTEEADADASETEHSDKQQQPQANLSAVGDAEVQVFDMPSDPVPFGE